MMQRCFLMRYMRYMRYIEFALHKCVPASCIMFTNHRSRPSFGASCPRPPALGDR